MENTTRAHSCLKSIFFSFGASKQIFSKNIKHGMAKGKLPLL
jgi:hypothetical protein